MTRLTIFLVFSVSVSVVVCQQTQPDLPSSPQPNPVATQARSNVQHPNPNPNAPHQNPNDVQIVTEENEVQPEGKFHWLFELSDGTKQEQEGEPKQLENGTAIVVKGSSTWVDQEGKTHSLTYVADENGYQPQGDDVPAIPDAIAKSLQENAGAGGENPSSPAGIQRNQIGTQQAKSLQENAGAGGENPSSPAGIQRNQVGTQQEPVTAASV